MKKVISFLLAIALVIACAPVIPITANAATSGTCGGNLIWKLDDAGILTISGTGAMENYYNHESSSAPWDNSRSSIKSVIIEEGVTSIGYYAFSYCSSLTSVVIPDSVTSIGWYAFYNCSSLTSIIIPNSVTSIGGWAFQNCDSLTSIEIPSSVTSIGDWAFSYCSSLESVVIPDGVKYIGDHAFSDCRSLISVVIGDSVTSIDDWAFSYCSKLTSVTIGNSVTSIGDYAFFCCSSLTSVTIPDSVTSIGDHAFSYCSSLKNVYYAGSQAQWNAITIGSDNTYLTNATIHYNHIHDYSLVPPAVVAPTCTQAGSAQYTCIYGENHTEALAPLGHDYSGEITAVPPTCTEQGYTAIKCTRCDAAKKTNYTAALGHNCPSVETTKEPTCTEKGITTGQCTNCGATIQDTIAELGHKMVAVPAVDATCTTDGTTVGTKCERCDYYGVTPTTIPATGHSFADGACTGCGLEGIAVHKQGDTETYYKTMEEVLAVTGGTIQLLADVTGDVVSINPGVVLDLNGYTLTANSVTGHVMDSTDGNGLVKVGAKNAALTSSDDQLILWDNTTDNSGYRVFNYSFVNLGVDAHKDDAKESKTAGKTIQSYWSDLVFTNPYAYTLAASGKSGLEIAFELSWTPEGGEKTSKTFQFGNAVVADWAQEEESNAGDKNYCFYIRVDGFEEIKSSGTVAVKPVLKTAFNSAETAVTENRYNYQTPAPGGLVYEYGFGNLNK